MKYNTIYNVYSGNLIPVKRDKTPDYDSKLLRFGQQPDKQLFGHILTLSLEGRGYHKQNFALKTGKKIGDHYLVVADIDQKGGLPEMEKYNTLTVRTGRGKHYYFLTDEPLNACIKRNGRIIGHIKGENCYVVCPPSVHANGKAYKFDNPLADIAIVSSSELMDLCSSSDTTSQQTNHNDREAAHQFTTDAIINLLKTNTAVKGIIKNKALDVISGNGAFASRSEADFALILSLLRQGYSEDEIVKVYEKSPHDKHHKKEKFLRKDIVRAKQKLARKFIKENREVITIASGIAALCLDHKFLAEFFGKKSKTMACILLQLANSMLQQSTMTPRISATTFCLYKGITPKTISECIDILTAMGLLVIVDDFSTFKSRSFAPGNELIRLARQYACRDFSPLIFSTKVNQARRNKGVNFLTASYCVNISPLLRKGFSMRKACAITSFPYKSGIRMRRWLTSIGLKPHASLEEVYALVSEESDRERCNRILNSVIQKRARMQIFRSMLGEIATRETNTRLVVPSPTGAYTIFLLPPEGQIKNNLSIKAASLKDCDAVVGICETLETTSYYRFLCEAQKMLLMYIKRRSGEPSIAV